MNNISDLIRDTAIHSSLYADPAIFELEMARIFHDGWVYVGHDSEIPKRGDYLRRTMGLEPVILARGASGIHVVANRCAHRGNLLCQQERGNRKVLACQYHGWVFGLDGNFLDMPLSTAECEGSTGRNLKRATVDVYNGFVFATFNPAPAPLREHLGNAAAALDRAVELSPAREVQIRGSWVRHLFRANWKMLSENEADGYHVSFVHDSFTKAVAARGKYVGVLSGSEAAMSGVVRALGHGHTELDYSPGYTRPLEWLGVPEDRFPEYTSAMSAAYGEERAREISRAGPPHTFIFPNLFLAETALVMIQPLGIGESVNWHAPLYLKGAPEALNTRILRKSEVALGPASFLTADDAIIAERQWRALRGSPAWLDLSRGVARERSGGTDTVESHYTDETSNRGFWRHYRAVMTAPEGTATGRRKFALQEAR